jgi:hypothetical protein
VTPRTVNIVCAKAPVRVGCVRAVLVYEYRDRWWLIESEQIRIPHFECSWCGARVRVVA